jgi:hypothetical protein
MTAVPELKGVKMTEQTVVAELRRPRPQLPPELKVPEALLVPARLSRTVPNGVVGVAELSVTETVQVEGPSTAVDDGEQETLVMVVWSGGLTVKLELPEWPASPP